MLKGKKENENTHNRNNETNVKKYLVTNKKNKERQKIRKVKKKVTEKKRERKREGKYINRKKQSLILLRIELRTFCVLGRCDNHYTTESAGYVGCIEDI